MIKTLAEHVRFSLYEVKGSYHVNKQATLTRTLIILLAILSEFSS